MTDAVVLRFVDIREAADLAAFLTRLVRYDRAAAVRLRAQAGVLAAFGCPPSFEVLAIRTARLAPALVNAAAPADGPERRTAAGTGPDEPLDLTVSAGQLADTLDAAVRTADEQPSASGSAALVVTPPAPVTGPPWTGVLPPRTGWQRVPGLPGVEAARQAVASAVAEFRARDAALPEQRRTREERDRIGRDIWSRTLGDSSLPLRALHAAHALGFLPPSAGGGTQDPLVLLAAGGWLRLRTRYGSVAVRRAAAPRLTVSPA